MSLRSRHNSRFHNIVIPSMTLLTKWCCWYITLAATTIDTKPSVIPSSDSLVLGRTLCLWVLSQLVYWWGSCKLSFWNRKTKLNQITNCLTTHNVYNSIAFENEPALSCWNYIETKKRNVRWKTLHSVFMSINQAHTVCILMHVPDSKVHGANMGPTWVLSAPGGPHVGPMNLAIRDVSLAVTSAGGFIVMQLLLICGINISIYNSFQWNRLGFAISNTASNKMVGSFKHIKVW